MIPQQLKKFTESRGMRFLTQYLVFVVVSAFFWMFVSFNNVIQRDISMPLEIHGVPDSLKIISDVPETINVGLSGTGSSFLYYFFGAPPKVRINFKDYAHSGEDITVTTEQMRELMRRMFNRSLTVTSINPGALKLHYASAHGKKVPVRIDIAVTPNMKYEINGPVETDVDSVTIYADRNVLERIQEVYTYHVEESGMTDTLHRNVRIAPIQDVRIEPQSVTIMVPIEPLIKKTLEVPINVANLPNGIQIITFPAKVTASFLLPQSMFHRSRPSSVKAVVDYNEVMRNPNKRKMEVRVAELPAAYRDVTLNIDSVEFVIEQK